MVSCDSLCTEYPSSSTIARVSILGFFDNRTTSASACATSFEPFDATSTRNFGDSGVCISANDEQELDALGMLDINRDRSESGWSAIVSLEGNTTDIDWALFSLKESGGGVEARRGRRQDDEVIRL